METQIKMRILHFSNKPAFPRIDGGTIAISELLKALTMHAEVYHFTLSTQKHPFHRSAYPETLNTNYIDAVEIDSSVTVLGALVSLIKNESYNVKRFISPKVKERLLEVIEEFQPEVAVLESIFVLPYLSLLKEKGIRVIVRTHNVEHLLWKQQASNCTNPLKKAYLNLLAKQLKSFEINHLNKADGIIAIAKDDEEFWRKTLQTKNVITIPTSFEVSSASNYNATDIYFLGAFDWSPNAEGMQWFLSEVFPKVQQPAILHIAGKNLRCSDFSDEHVVCHGEIASASDFINEHGICIIPLLSGGGIKMKLLENMAHGKPIVSTNEGVRGIHVQHDKEVLIAQSADEFAQHINQLIARESERKRLGETAKQFIIDNFGIDKIGIQIIEFIQK
jgi:polysaccharide biosynthesis protein PslH